jgi:drug/metabolite transporter (DMT)-like permease
MNSTQAQPGMDWLFYSLMTVAAWGAYGVCLHTGQVSMADPANGRWKAFFFVGVAYFLTAVVAPLALLLARGAGWKMPQAGVTWSLVAGLVGALGAFGVLLAFGAKGTPAVVMSIVFGGAPVVNALLAMAMHPPKEGWSAIKWQFVTGILLAAVGGTLVTLYRPPPPAPHAPPPATHTAPVEK